MIAKETLDNGGWGDWPVPAVPPWWILGLPTTVPPPPCPDGMQWDEVTQACVAIFTGQGIGTLPLPYEPLPVCDNCRVVRKSLISFILLLLLIILAYWYYEQG